ncbi:MAG TPA: hypothetical protein VMZ71_14795 [Gemmataceae bacterium]|nr:hypothetical protein [Gemmataceae bacterium]
MTTRTVLLSLHIAAIASWLGADMLQHAVRRRWQRETGDAALAFARMVHWLHDRYYAVVAGLIALTGVGLVFDGDWSWGSGFIWVGISTVVLGGVLGGVVLKLLSKKQVDALEAGDSGAAHETHGRAVPIEMFLTTAVLVTIVAMVGKWRA